MPRIPLLLLALSLASTARADVDPKCANMKGWERLNPLAPYPLTLIRKCIVVYCNAQVPDAARKNLNTIDTTLVNLQKTGAETGMAVQKFNRACKALKGDLQQVGPKMDAFRTASYELSVKKGDLTQQYEAIQKSPLEDLFSKTSSSMLTDYQQPDCMNQINQQTIDGLNAAQKTLDGSQVDCAPK